MENIDVLRVETIRLSSYHGGGTYIYKIIIYNNGNFIIDLLPNAGYMFQVYGRQYANYKCVSNKNINSFQSQIINILTRPTAVYQNYIHLFLHGICRLFLSLFGFFCRKLTFLY